MSNPAIIETNYPYLLVSPLDSKETVSSETDIHILHESPTVLRATVLALPKMKTKPTFFPHVNDVVLLQRYSSDVINEAGWKFVDLSNVYGIEYK